MPGECFPKGLNSKISQSSNIDHRERSPVPIADSLLRSTSCKRLFGVEGGNFLTRLARVETIIIRLESGMLKGFARKQ